MSLNDCIVKLCMLHLTMIASIVALQEVSKPPPQVYSIDLNVLCTSVSPSKLWQ